MWSGRKGEERRECNLNSTPSTLFCFLYFIFRKIRGEERREFEVTDEGVGGREKRECGVGGREKREGNVF